MKNEGCPSVAWDDEEDPSVDYPWHCVFHLGHAGEHGDPDCNLAWPQGSQEAQHRQPNLL